MFSNVFFSDFLCIRKVTAKSLSRNGIAKSASFVYRKGAAEGGRQTRRQRWRLRRRRRQTQPLALSAREQIKRMRKERRIMRESAREQQISTLTCSLARTLSHSQSLSAALHSYQCQALSVSERGRPRENVRHKIIDSYHSDFRIVVVVVLRQMISTFFLGAASGRWRGGGEGGGVLVECPNWISVKFKLATFSFTPWTWFDLSKWSIKFILSWSLDLSSSSSPALISFPRFVLVFKASPSKIFAHLTQIYYI